LEAISIQCNVELVPTSELDSYILAVPLREESILNLGEFHGCERSASSLTTELIRLLTRSQHIGRTPHGFSSPDAVLTSPTLRRFGCRQHLLG